jgi:pyridoxal phosphate enzyme (YggS family)
VSLKEILEKVGKAKILAVSKLQTPEKIRLLYQEGQRLFGENYAQEALEKMELLEDLPDIEWHLIGHLQRNKAKLIIGKFHLIHSVDTLELAEILNKLALAKGIRQNVLIQVNLAMEETKSGFNKENLEFAWPKLIELKGLKIMGLMTMPPLTEDGVEARPFFRELHELRARLRDQTDPYLHPLTELSMGTSSDYMAAVAEGATILRLGTILFGERESRR